MKEDTRAASVIVVAGTYLWLELPIDTVHVEQDIRKSVLPRTRGGKGNNGRSSMDHTVIHASTPMTRALEGGQFNRILPMVEKRKGGMYCNGDKHSNHSGWRNSR